MDVVSARDIARELLAAPLPQRWVHTQGVARRARELSPQVGPDGDLLEAAAWLHDVGYSPALATTGFHPLDGARYLRDVVHASGVLCELVAHHSGAVYEAEERGLLSELTSEFGPGPQSLVSWALTAADMTTSPRGEPEDADARISEILTRYDVDSPVHRAVSRSAEHLFGVVHHFDDGPPDLR